MLSTRNPFLDVTAHARAIQGRFRNIMTICTIHACRSGSVCPSSGVQATANHHYRQGSPSSEPKRFLSRRTLPTLS